MGKMQIKKSNFLVPLEEAVSKPAQLLASYLVASLPKSRMVDSELPELRFSYGELRSSLNADGRERVNKVQDIIDLGIELQKCILFYEDNVSERTVSWLIGQERNKRTNTFTYTLHPGLKKYLINLENHFTRYNYLFRVCLNAHSMKLYEIMKMYQYLGEVVLNIEDEIKPPLGLAGKYPKVYDFKRRVLNVAQKEIEQYTDIRFDYEVAVKKGKTPVSFRFYISENKPTDLPLALLNKFKAEGGRLPDVLNTEAAETIEFADASHAHLYEKLEEWGGKKEKIADLIRTHGEAAMTYQIKHLQRVLQSGKQIDNPFAWFAKALQSGYKDAAQDKKVQQKSAVSSKRAARLLRKKKEKDLKTLEDTLQDKMKEQCDLLLQENPGLLDNTVEILRDNFMVRRALNSGKTNEEVYQNAMTTWAVQAEMHKMFPERFKAIKGFYQPQIDALKREIGQ